MKWITARSTSILSAMTAGACCLPPLILLALGVGSVGAAGALARFHGWFLTAGIAMLGVAWGFYFREHVACATGKCSAASRRITLAVLTAATLIVALFAAGAAGALLGRIRDAAIAPHATPPGAPTNDGLQTAEIPVSGLTCVTCEWHVEKVLGETEGVVSAKASTSAANVVVRFDPNRTDLPRLIETIDSRTPFRVAAPERPNSTPKENRK